MKQVAPAAARNRDPIADVLARELPTAGLVLEVASGTGEHVVHFAQRLPALQWQPTDPDEGALASIAAWRADAGLDNILPPVMLDAAAIHWPVERADAVVCINMIHISPPASGEGLCRAAGRLLAPGAPLILYGPFLETGVPTASSNLEFDTSLKSRNPAWGLRDVAWVDGLAHGHDLVGWLLLLAIGITGSIGQLLLTAALRFGKVASVIVMDYSALFWATLYGWLWFDMLPPTATWAGMPLVVAAGLLIAWREHKLSKERRAAAAAEGT